MASSAIDLLIGKLVLVLENEVLFLGEIHDQLDEIKRELVTMKAFLEDAERKGAQSEVVKTWVANVRDVSMDIEDIIAEFLYDENKKRSRDPFTRTLRQTIRFPKTIWKTHQTAAKLQKIIKMVKAIPERNQRYGVDRIEVKTCHNYDPNQAEIYSESSLFFKDDDVVGIADAKTKLTGWLLSGQPQRTVISVVGMGGSGKTTLVANTFNSQIVKQHFDCYAWITVSQTYTVKDLLRSMIIEVFGATKEGVPLGLSNMSYKSLVEMLVDYLHSKKYVIVLDDVWDIDLWSSINVALPDGTHGSRIMVTTRNQDIAYFPFGAGSLVHPIQPLKKNEAWELFCMKAFPNWPNSCCPAEFELVARDLVGRCEGLPLGIVALGALMSTKNLVSDWRTVYSSLNWELSNNPRLEVVKSILLLSFNDLPYRLKHCFLYFCIFPEDYLIMCGRIIRLWIAEGFVEQVRGAKPEEIAESYITQLACRGLIQVEERETSGRAKALKMHDLLRELAITISGDEKFCRVYNEQEAIEESRACRLSVHANCGEIRTNGDMSKVRTFFLFAPDMDNPLSLNKLTSRFKLLRVLDLEDVPIVQLPNQVVKFFNLKYLNLKGTKLKELPNDIGKLDSLETLDIRDSKIRFLPGGILKLQNLRYLFMYHFNYGDLKLFDFIYGTKVPSDIYKPRSLQVLDTVEVGSKLVGQLRYMTHITRLGLTNVREAYENDLCKSIESMKLIEYLAVKTCNEEEVLRMDALSSAPPLLKELSLCGKLEKVPMWFRSLQSLTTLTLHWSRLTENFLPNIQELPNLVELELSNAYEGKKLGFYSGFPKLTYLFLNNLPQLNSIFINKGVMPALQKLEISECMNFKQLPFGIEHFTCLQELNLRSVPDELVKQICQDRTVYHSKVEHISDINYYVYNPDFGWSRERLPSSQLEGETSCRILQKSTGVEIPPREENSAPLFTPAEAQPIVFPVEQCSDAPIDASGLSLPGIQKAQRIAHLLMEMLNGLELNSESLKEEKIVDLLHVCRSYQKRVTLLVNNTEDEELLCQGLALNDNLQRVLSQYDDLVKGTTSAIRGPESTVVPLVNVNLEDDDIPQLAYRSSRDNSQGQGQGSAANVRPLLPPPPSPKRSISTGAGMIDYLSGDPYSSEGSLATSESTSFAVPVQSSSTSTSPPSSLTTTP